MIFKTLAEYRARHKIPTEINGLANLLEQHGSAWHCEGFQENACQTTVCGQDINHWTMVTVDTGFVVYIDRDFPVVQEEFMQFLLLYQIEPVPAGSYRYETDILHGYLSGSRYNIGHLVKCLEAQLKSLKVGQ